MNKCDKSENQLFDSMIRFIKNGVLLVRDPHLAAKVAIIPNKWKSLTKRTPKMKLQQAFILEVQMINNLCFDANLS